MAPNASVIAMIKDFMKIGLLIAKLTYPELSQFLQQYITLSSQKSMEHIHRGQHLLFSKTANYFKKNLDAMFLTFIEVGQKVTLHANYTIITVIK
jgi:hypothetical protein